jgi:hypothetical protein
MKKLTPILIVILGMLMPAGCSSRPVMVVSNLSEATLTNVMLSGSGFSQRIGRLSPHATARYTIHTKSPSGVRVAFDTAGAISIRKARSDLSKTAGDTSSTSPSAPTFG